MPPNSFSNMNYKYDVNQKKGKNQPSDNKPVANHHQLITVLPPELPPRNDEDSDDDIDVDLDAED